jgi:hypothetical protein
MDSVELDQWILSGAHPIAPTEEAAPVKKLTGSKAVRNPASSAGRRTVSLPRDDRSTAGLPAIFDGLEGAQFRDAELWIVSARHMVENNFPEARSIVHQYRRLSQVLVKRADYVKPDTTLMVSHNESCSVSILGVKMGRVISSYPLPFLRELAKLVDRKRAEFNCKRKLALALDIPVVIDTVEHVHHTRSDRERRDVVASQELRNLVNSPAYVEARQVEIDRLRVKYADRLSS